LTTREFFQVIKDHLSDNGGMVINVARVFDDRRLLDSLYQTISLVFPSVYIVDIPNTLNSNIFATKNITDSENLTSNYIEISEKQNTPVFLLSALEIAIMNIQPEPEAGRILTDNHAPVEWIMNVMIWELLTSEAMSKLQ
jgi:spermidine synthase